MVTRIRIGPLPSSQNPIKNGIWEKIRDSLLIGSKEPWVQKKFLKMAILQFPFLP